MKIARRICGFLVLACLTAHLVPAASGIGGPFSDTIWLDQYTVLTDGSVTHNTGHLIGKGVFQVITTETLDPFYVNLVGIGTFTPISGGVIMMTDLFDPYKADRLIPKWTRSIVTYSIGSISYVTVTPRGFKPVAIKQPRKSVVPIIPGRPITLRATAQGTHPFIYQWYFTDVPYDISNTNADYYSEWLSTAAPVTNAINQTYKIANPQQSDAGDYFVRVTN